MADIIKIDLQDEFKEDNIKFFHLLDKNRWDKLIGQVEEEEPLEELLEELINDR